MKADMKKYVNNAELHDVLIKIDNTTLYAHKIILSQCTKFDKIFQSNSNPIVEVSVDDVKYSVFMCLLHYLYYEGLVNAQNINMQISTSKISFKKVKHKKPLW